MKIGRRRWARIHCFISLYLYDIGKMEVDEIINGYIPNLENTGVMRDKSTYDFYLKLFRGTVNHIKEIDTIIKNASQKWDFDGIYATDKAILRMATYEIIYIKTEVPIVIDEAVEISKMYSPNEIKGPNFINGILDTIAKANIKNAQH